MGSDRTALARGIAEAQGRQAPRTRPDGPRKRPVRAESSERLGRHRWVLERPLSWLNRYRRLKVLYERRADIPRAFFDLGCALIC